MRNLYEACKIGDLESVKYFTSIQRRWDWNYGFACACENGHLEIAQLMISNGECSLLNGFLKACSGGHLQIVQFMVSEPGIISRWNEPRVWTYGLEYACMGGQLEMANWIILNAKETIDFNQCLYSACLGDHMELVHLLISKTGNTTDWNRGFFGACMGKMSAKAEKLMLLNGASYIPSVFLKWPRDEIQITRLLYFGAKLDTFDQIDGYQNLLKIIIAFKNSILGVRVLLPELLSLVSKFLIF